MIIDQIKGNSQQAQEVLCSFISDPLNSQQRS
jgi:hypothetical protein